MQPKNPSRPGDRGRRCICLDFHPGAHDSVFGIVRDGPFRRAILPEFHEPKTPGCSLSRPCHVRSRDTPIRREAELQCAIIGAVREASNEDSIACGSTGTTAAGPRRGRDAVVLLLVPLLPLDELFLLGPGPVPAGPFRVCISAGEGTTDGDSIVSSLIGPTRPRPEGDCVAVVLPLVCLLLLFVLFLVDPGTIRA